MNDFANEYEMVLKQVKALFMDKVYREQGLVTMFTNTLYEFDEESQDYLKGLFSQQADQIEKVLGLMDDLEDTILEVENIGNTIKNAIDGSEVVSSDDEQGEEKKTSNDEKTEKEEKKPSSEEESKKEVKKASVEEEAEKKEKETSSEEEPKKEVKKAVVEEEAEKEVKKPSSEEEPKKEANKIVVEEKSEASDEESSKEKQPLNFDGNVLKIDNKKASIEGGVVPFSLELASEGENVVIPSVDKPKQEEQENVSKEEKQEVAKEKTAEELINAETQTFIRNTKSKVKAILVSKTQYRKLNSSRETQKALFDTKKKSATNVLTPIDENVKIAVEEKKVENEASSEDSYTNVQMEELMNKANALYQEGKLDEAQELYNKISELNSGLEEDDSN